MHIGFVTTEFPGITPHSGGIGTYLAQLAHDLMNDGFEVTIFLLGQPTDHSFDHLGIHMFAIKNVRVPGLSAWFTQKKLGTLINHLHKNNPIDLIEVPDWCGWNAFLQTAIPVLVKIHGSDTYFCELEGRPSKLKNRFLEKRGLKRATAVTSVSKYAALTTQKVFQIPEIPIQLSYNSVDVKRFEPPNQRDSNKMLYIGAIIRKKGVIELAHIFNLLNKEFPLLEWHMVGRDVIDESTLTSTIQLIKDVLSDSARDKLFLHGAVTAQEVPTILQNATLAVFPSFAEAFPISWLESMATATPMVTSNIGWSKEMITRQKEGLTAHPKNHQEFADHIRFLIENPSIATAYGQAARQRVISDFCSSRRLVDMINYYKKVIESYHA